MSLNFHPSLSFVVPHTSFLPTRYKIIQKDKVPAAVDDKKRSIDLLTKYDKTKKEWQFGKTKVRFSSFWQQPFRL